MIAAAGRAPAIIADRTLLGVAIFIASESVFFLAVIVAYVANREAGTAEARAHLDVARTAVFSVALFASSGTMALAVSRAAPRWLLATFALGLIFIGGQGAEYVRLLATGIGPSSALFGTTFFTLTGLHAMHVLVGLVAQSALAVALLRRAAAVRPVAWEAIALYWHFVDGVWVAVFTVVYLGSLL